MQLLLLLGGMPSSRDTCSHGSHWIMIRTGNTVSKSCVVQALVLVTDVTP